MIPSEARTAHTPIKIYNATNNLVTSVVGTKSPKPTVVRVTTEK